MKLIDKDALVSEIESKFQRYWKLGEESDALQDGNAKYWGGVLSCLNEVKTLIDTLEVKEVDLEKEINEWLLHGNITDNYYDDYCDDDIIETAKHFFELGLKTAQKGE